MTTSVKNDFSGIWGESGDNIKSRSNDLAKKRPDLGAPTNNKPKKKFGYLHVFMNFIALMVLSTVLSMVYVPLTGNTDPAALVKDPVFLLLSSGLMYVIWLTGAWFASWKGGTKSVVKDLLLKVKPKDILWGLLFAGLFFGFSTLLGWFVSDVIGVDLKSSDNTGTLTQFSGPLLFVFAYGIGAFIGPLVEEIFFRGLILQAGINSFRKAKEAADLLGENTGFIYKLQSGIYKAAPVLSLVVSSVIFGFMHFQFTEAAWYTILVTGLLGLGMGILTLKFKRLGPAIFAHMFFNAINVTLALYIM